MSILLQNFAIDDIDQLHVLVTSNKQSLTQAYQNICDAYPNRRIYLLNGGMWNPDGSPCRGLKVDGNLLSLTPWDNMPGFAWNDAYDIVMTTNWKDYRNFISCTALLQNGNKIKLSYGNQQGGVRGRSAFGLKNGAICMYCSQDGSTDAMSPEQLQDYLYRNGWTDAIMLDSGGSSMCNFDGKIIKGDGRKVHNWIVVVTKDEAEGVPDQPEIDHGNTIISDYITQNPCYTKPELMQKSKMMLHSTGTPGANHTKIKAGMNSQAATTSVEFCIDDTGIYQFLPLGRKSWHCGGTGNSTHIACEICEPIATRLLDANWKPLYRGGKNNTTWAVTQLQKELLAWGYDPKGVDGNFGPGCEAAVKSFQKAQGLAVDGSCGPATLHKLQTRKASYLAYDTYYPITDAYFQNVYRKAVWLFATILQQVGGNPQDIVCHREGYAMGIASNHADVMHWFPQHGKSMDDFREDVFTEMRCHGGNSDVPDAWAKSAWEKATSKGIVDGTRPKDAVTRQEAAVILDRLGLLTE